MKGFRFGSVVLAAISILLAPIAVFGHHSRAEFSGEVFELEGTIAETIWVNPHPYVVLSVADNDGTADWRIEIYGNLFSTERIGLRGDQFLQGTQLRVAGSKSTRREHYLLAYNVLLADGTEAVLAAQSRPRWADKALQGDDGRAEYEAFKGLAASENRGIFRVWTPDPDARSQEQGFPYTAAALAARSKWDELNSFQTRCEQPGMPRTMMTPQEIEFIDAGATIQVRAQYFDTVRTIHMDGARDSADQPASHLGSSVGRWEGPSLVIETSKINWPYFDTNGTPQSEAVHVIERYTVSDDQSRLHGDLTITDPATFTQPALWAMEWLALGRTIRKFDCQVLQLR